MTAETERVIHDGVDLHWPRGIGDVIQIARRIGHLVIDRWWHDIHLYGLGAGYHFDRPGSPEHVARRAFGGTDRKFAGMVAEYDLYRFGFRYVALRRRSAVRVNV